MLIAMPVQRPTLHQMSLTGSQCCRSMLAAGTLAQAGADQKQLAKDLGLSDIVQRLQAQSGLESKLKSACQEVQELLQ